MKPVLISFLLACAAFSLRADGNLVRNGSFDAGSETASNWERPDELTSFWVQDGERERVLKLDSRVDRIQALAHGEARKKNPAAPPPKPKFPKPPAYNSIGGNEGVLFDSDLIDVKPGQNYSLSIDAKGNSNPFVWIKGFRVHPRRKSMLDSYQTRLHAYPLSADDWRTFTIGFNPTARSPHTTKMKVRIYVYWPPGVCYFDNVRLREITPQEMKALTKDREKTTP